MVDAHKIWNEKLIEQAIFVVLRNILLIFFNKKQTSMVVSIGLQGIVFMSCIKKVFENILLLDYNWQLKVKCTNHRAIPVLSMRWRPECWSKDRIMTFGYRNLIFKYLIWTRERNLKESTRVSATMRQLQHSSCIIR